MGTGLSRRAFILAGSTGAVVTMVGCSGGEEDVAGSATPVAPSAPPTESTPPAESVPVAESILPSASSQRSECALSPDTLVLVNGRIHTMDDDNSVVDSIAIRDGKFVQVGEVSVDDESETVIDLRGRTVIPGLIESHTHIISLANRPGYHTSIELTTSIAEVQATLAARRRRGDVPEGQFITAMGGFNPRQWWPLGEPPRLPTLGELDEAVSDRPVLIVQGFFGPAVVNGRAKEFFEAATGPLAGPVPVGDDGSIAMGAPCMAALYHLRLAQTVDDRRRSALDAMAHSARVGVTTVNDLGVFMSPEALAPDQPVSAIMRAYDSWLDLHRTGEAFVRLQINHFVNQGYIEEFGPIDRIDRQLPALRALLRYQFPFFGGAMVRYGGIGEEPAPLAPPSDPNGYAVWSEAQRLVARARWRNENGPRRIDEIEQVVSMYEQVDTEMVAAGHPEGIKDLRWGLQHAHEATAEQLARLKALNAGLSMSGFAWIAQDPTPDGTPSGPNFRRIVDSGVRAGLHADGVHFAPHNPFYSLHYATTGLNVYGQQVNSGQQITRQEALYAHTRGNAWYLNREDEIGSIEVGKLADLVVLSDDYFTVSDESMRRILPILTVVDGKLVHDSGEL